jgi:serine/threonine protein kinase
MGKVFTITEDLENMGTLRSDGQGSVYKAKRSSGMITAVNLLPAPVHTENNDDKTLEDFQNEVEKLKKVNEEPNPHVVKILSSGITESGSFPFIEMEFIDGTDLEELLKPPHSALFSVSEVIKVADQLSNALAHCHKVGVKHGDLKSKSVKLNARSGNYILLNFGLSAMQNEQRRSSLEHAGAIEFMAPEQNGGQMLFQTDIYSFGVILFQLLAGEVPFPLSDNEATSRNAVMASHVETPVPNLMLIRRSRIPADWPQDKRQSEMQVPEWLLEVIYKCLEKKPENRYQDGIELHKAMVSHSDQAVKGNANDPESDSVLQREVNRPNAPLLQYQEATATVPRPAKIRDRQRDEDLIDKKTKSGITISKPVFFTLVVLLAGLGALAAYSFLNKEPQSEEAATLPIEGLALADSAGLTPEDYSIGASPVPIDTAALNAENQRLRDSISLLRKLNARRIQDSVKQAKKYSALKQKLAKTVRNKQERIVYKEEKKRKKGFLGIRFGKKEDF